GNPINAPTTVFYPNEVEYGLVVVTAGQNSSTLIETTDGGSLGLQFNSIADATPLTASGWGNRITFGWVQNDRSSLAHKGGGTGWMISIIDGVDMNETHQFGLDDKRLRQLAGADGLDGIDGDQNLVDNGGNVIGQTGQPVGPVTGIIGIPADEGLTTVGVNFGFQLGFENLLSGFIDDNGDGAADDVNNDGVVDDLDRVQIGVSFDQMNTAYRTKMSGVELMAIRRKKALYAGAYAEMYFGARFLELDDRFSIRAVGGVLSDWNLDQNALNRIIGPQFGVRVARRTNRWSSIISGRFMAGANFQSTRQFGVIGDHSSTNSGVGLPDSFGGADYYNTARKEIFSPVGEFKIESSMNVTRSMTAKVGWTGIVVGGVSRAANTIDYALPTFAILDRDEVVFTHGVTFGVEFNR
ncbi:MAG: BBP7 family outer membrane beta-barrel protein, partial [Planctomycetota bacterium]